MLYCWYTYFIEKEISFMEKLNTKTLTSKERRLLEENLDSLVSKYKDKGLLLESIIPIIGNPPRIPDSPDMDARMEAYEARAEYGSKAQEIEKILSEKASSINSKGDD